MPQDATFGQIEQVLGMAYIAIGEYERAFAALAGTLDPYFLNTRQAEAQRQWDVAWEQMTLAERLIRERGRDTLAFGAVRDQLPIDQSAGDVTRDGNTVRWRGFKPQLLTEALAALLVAVPEVSRENVMAESTAVPALTGSRTGLVVIAIVVLVIIGFVTVLIVEARG